MAAALGVPPFNVARLPPIDTLREIGCGNDAGRRYFARCSDTQADARNLAVRKRKQSSCVTIFIILPRHREFYPTIVNFYDLEREMRRSELSTPLLYQYPGKSDTRVRSDAGADVNLTLTSPILTWTRAPLTSARIQTLSSQRRR